jgi:hypothetical protein
MIVWTPRSPAAAFVPLLAFHMPRARSHGILRFSVARRIQLAYTYRDFWRHGGRRPASADVAG